MVRPKKSTCLHDSTSKSPTIKLYQFVVLLECHNLKNWQHINPTTSQTMEEKLLVSLASREKWKAEMTATWK